MSHSERQAASVAVDRHTATHPGSQLEQPGRVRAIPAMQAIGVDIVDVRRLQMLYARWHECLLARLFTEQEQRLCRQVTDYRWCSLAGRFSAKEAVKKILASRGEVAGWTEIEVLNGPYGEPYINLYGRAQAALGRSGYSGLVLSISHDASLAIATVLAY